MYLLKVISKKRCFKFKLLLDSALKLYMDILNQELSGFKWL